MQMRGSDRAHRCGDFQIDGGICLIEMRAPLRVPNLNEGRAAFLDHVAEISPVQAPSSSKCIFCAPTWKGDVSKMRETSAIDVKGGMTNELK